jgi:Zn-dependent protease with chaperone function
MEQQSYAKHAQFVAPFHFVLAPMAILAVIGAIVNVVRAAGHGNGRLGAAVLLLLSLVAFGALFFGRIFALKVQDRLIRSEENMRHYLLSGKPLDARLTLDQLIGLRFAADAEFLALAQRAAAEQLTRDAIKRSVQSWRVDNARL